MLQPTQRTTIPIQMNWIFAKETQVKKNMIIGMCLSANMRTICTYHNKYMYLMIINNHSNSNNNNDDIFVIHITHFFTQIIKLILLSFFFSSVLCHRNSLD